MWRVMTAAQELAWHNGYFAPNDVRETDHGVEWFDSAHMHMPYSETATPKDVNGEFRVNVYCECGRWLSSHLDSV